MPTSIVIGMIAIQKVQIISFFKSVRKIQIINFLKCKKRPFSLLRMGSYIGSPKIFISKYVFLLGNGWDNKE
jgi:hypothetical protein